MDKRAKKGTLRIPSCLTDITADWVAELLYRVLGVPEPADKEGTHNGITLLQIRAATTGEGFRDSCHVTAKSASEPEDRTHHLLVEVVPSDEDLRAILSRHGLFSKEILIYEEVLPMLKCYVRRRSELARTKAVDVNFFVPDYIYGDYSSETGDGVIVFQDYSETGFSVEDPDLLLIEGRRARQLVGNLATFHAICLAFQTTEEKRLEELFPALDGQKGGCAWFQEDMSSFLDEMYSTCQRFLQSVPGQEDLSRWFEEKMSNPEALHEEFRNRDTKLRTLIHGDLWHNNIFFKTMPETGAAKLLLTDWQMSHIGIATNDLCFLLFSSTTPRFRQENWDSTLRLYYDAFNETLRAMSVEGVDVAYEEFLLDVKASIPISLFFCGNIQDLDTSVEMETRTAAVAQLECDSPYSTVYGSDEETLRKLQSCFSYFDQQQLRRDLDFGEAEDDDDESEGITISFSTQHSKDSETGAAPPSSKQNVDKCQTEQPDLVMLPNRGLPKVPTIASDKELAKLESIRKATSNRQLQQQQSSSSAAAAAAAAPAASSSSGSKTDASGKGRLDPKKARALRRKLYLDLYREAASKLPLINEQ